MANAATAIQYYPATGENPWQDVDESTSDGDATYLYNNYNYAVNCELYLTDPGISTGTINSVDIRGYLRAYPDLGGTPPQIQIEMNVGGGASYAYMPYAKATSTSWTAFSTGTPWAPDLGPWTWAKLQDLRIMVRMRYGDSNPHHIRLSQIYIAVDYTPVLTVPSVTTSAATSVSYTSATLNGSVTNTGGSTVTERGFEWDINSGVPYAQSWTEAGSFGVGSFSRALTNLSPNTTYYFRAKALNSTGWAYGSQLTFTTPAYTVPTLTIQSATNITDIQATLNGTITGVDGSNCSSRWFEWDTDSGAPYTYIWSEAGSWGTGAFSHTITGLTPNTTYYFRVGATNSAGSGYSSQTSFLSKQTYNSSKYISNKFKIPISMSKSISSIFYTGTSSDSKHISSVFHVSHDFSGSKGLSASLTTPSIDALKTISSSFRQATMDATKTASSIVYINEVLNDIHDLSSAFKITISGKYLESSFYILGNVGAKFGTIVLPYIQNTVIDNNNVIANYSIPKRNNPYKRKIATKGERVTIQGKILDDYYAMALIWNLADGTVRVLDLSDIYSPLEVWNALLVNATFNGSTGTAPIEYSLDFVKVDNP